MKHLLLRHNLAPGDVLVMTSCVESLHSQYPGHFLTSVNTNCMAIWRNNPRIVPVTPAAVPIEMHYPGINRSHKLETGHFMNSFCQYLGQILDIEINLCIDRPLIYLDQKEIDEGPPVKIDSPYMVINAGYKDDFTTKNWGHYNYQKLVDLTKDYIRWVQIGNSKDNHKPLDGVINLIDHTSARNLFKLCYHSLGGVGPTTFLQHIMASFNKWYGCILSSREPVSWVHYNTQTTFHTHGQFFCCEKRACWKSRVVSLKDGSRNDTSLCHLPLLIEGENVSACMNAIIPEQVAESVKNVIKYRKNKEGFFG